MAHTPYLKPYQDSAQRHGSNFAVTLWANQRSQETRFKVLTQLCDLTGKRVLDAGCSRGDLASFLIQHRVRFDRYTGIDGLCDVVQFATDRRMPRCHFLCGDLLTDPTLWSTHDPQVVIISGTLNTMSDPQVATALDAAWRAAGQALLFNFLPDHARHRHRENPGPARRLNALKLIQWAAARTSQFVYKQDYFPSAHDATIYMVKDASLPPPP